MKSDRVYLEHILEAIHRVQENTKDGWDVFSTAHVLQDATLRNLQTLAEASQRLSETARAARPEVEWKSVGAFRNVLVHNYLGVDLEIVWRVVQADLPRLESAVKALLEVAE